MPPENGDQRPPDGGAAPKPLDPVEEIGRLAGLSPLEYEKQRSAAATSLGMRVTALDAQVKRVQRVLRKDAAAAHGDGRPQVEAPLQAAPWLPVMRALGDVLGKSAKPEPPMRDLEGYAIAVHVRRISGTHRLTAATANAEPEAERLAPPEMPLLTRLALPMLAEQIEEHVDFIDEDGRSVHLAMPFVEHWRCRGEGDALPVVWGAATMPFILPGGMVLSGRGLDRARGVVFRVPPEIDALLPQPGACGAEEVAAAMRFLLDDWLADVATGPAGKCIAIAAALTIIERLILPQRPAFFITAGKRGGGKTTLADMLHLAALGVPAVAAAWSGQEDERRKALFAYMGDGAPTITWDNIPRGASISCHSIEKALTAEEYSDRVLGVSEVRRVPATTVQIFTGNNINPRGDLAARSLMIRLTTDRPDPENRPFRHHDPAGWTLANRGRLLRALYTVLLGNPQLRAPQTPETRFKVWWHLAGSAIEHAAASIGVRLRFRDLIGQGETDDEEENASAMVLDILRARWPKGAKAEVITAFARHEGALAVVEAEFRGALEAATGKPIKIFSPRTVTWRLKALRDAPVQVGEEVCVLRFRPDHTDHGGVFWVETLSGGDGSDG